MTLRQFITKILLFPVMPSLYMGGGGGGGIQETADQIQEQKNNTELWNYYATTYKPFIEKYAAKQTSNAASDNQMKQAAGQVNAEIMKNVTPTSMANNAVGMTRQLNNMADVQASATIDASDKVKQRQLGSLQNLVDIGRGQQTQAQQTQEQLTDQSVQSAIADKQRDLQTQAAWENAIGSGIGMAASAFTRMPMKSPAASGPESSFGVMQSDAGAPAFNADGNWFGG